MKRVYFVLGLENSGNRMMVQAFASSGCYGNPQKGELLGEQPADLKPQTWPDRVVFARSVPNGDAVPDPIALVQPMIAAGFEIIPVHIYRKTDFAIAGHVQHYHTTPEQAFQYLETCARLVHELAVAVRNPVVTVIYELFVRMPEYRKALFAELRLPEPTLTFYNGNEKYRLEHPTYAI